MTKIIKLETFHLSNTMLGIWSSTKLCGWVTLLTLSQTTNLDSSKLKEFADNNFKFNENGRKSSKRLENTVEKGDIAHYEKFFLFPTMF